MSSDGELFKFDSVELLSLYTTTVLQQLVTVVQPIEDRLLHLIQVLEHNLKNLKVERKWFLGTLRDHARLFNKEWKMGNTDGPDFGKIAYNTLLLAVALKIGLEKLWVNDGNTPVFNDMVMELTTLLHPKKITLAIKQLNRSNPLFDFLSSHSPDLEEINMYWSDVAAFQDCMKFKNLRVLELGGRISDKVLCSGLWNINKKSDKVLEMALKDNKGPESWQLSLPNLEVLRNNVFGDHHTNSMRVSLGAAALLIQPKMETVKTLTWDTNRAIMHLLDTEAKLKMIPVKQLTRLVLDATDLDHMEFTVLLAEMPNLNDLFLHITPDAVANYYKTSKLTPDATALYDPSHNTLQVRLDMLHHNLETLSLDFISTDMHMEQSLENEEFASYMISFLQNFPSVKRMNFYNTVFLPPPFLIFGCIGGALATLRKMKHITVQSCNEDIPRDKLTDPDDGCIFPILDSHSVQTHYMKAILMFPLLQKETTFQYLCTLKSLELDDQYFSPRVDRMVAALRASGVLVNGLYRTATATPRSLGVDDMIQALNS
ncbi:uncharacterized protein LOC126999223 isoform X2 [Eriocheir sinensis]|uniref:uncharacterized protein LOC126999223 isoform X2 n=1 Tax=Eriocheir sinensis TaxID=95602 RepID=UPI0021C6A82D|nr:uncharacterized protein LOC126999223 isoform X2 [Eriocheir sinensis]